MRVGILEIAPARCVTSSPRSPLPRVTARDNLPLV